MVHSPASANNGLLLIRGKKKNWQYAFVEDKDELPDNVDREKNGLFGWQVGSLGLSGYIYYPILMKLNFFKIFNRVVPDFEALKKSPIKDYYFYRAAPWYWLNSDMITVNDNHAPRVITMDPWPQMIFLDATGKLTITEYVDFIADKYKKEVPADLDTIILSMIDLLLKDRVICLSQVPRAPDPENNRPFK